MRPALSVIAFTTLSGAGYGLMIWLGLRYAMGLPLPLSREYALIPLGLALALVSVGLLSSLLHLGRPARAWRALSQWRSSWLSREGVASLLSYLPAVALAWTIWTGAIGLPSRLAGAVLVLLALATVQCTAMIYASLKTVRAWRNGWVPAAYLLFALLAGAPPLAALLGLAGWPLPGAVALAFAAGLVAFAVLKLAYWRWLDRDSHAATPESATGLGGHGRVRSFERPHTQDSFVTREMVFVLARKHARVLRTIALGLLAVLPLLLLAGTWALSWPLTPMAVAAALSLLAGGFVERWLLFAEARHVVSLYFGAARA